MSGVAFVDIEGTLVDGSLSRPFVRAGRAQHTFSLGALVRRPGQAGMGGAAGLLRVLLDGVAHLLVD